VYWFCSELTLHQLRRTKAVAQRTVTGRADLSVLTKRCLHRGVKLVQVQRGICGASRKDRRDERPEHIARVTESARPDIRGGSVATVAHIDGAQLKWGRKGPTEFAPTNRHRPAKFPFACLATPNRRSRGRLAVLARKRHQPIFSCSAGLCRTYSSCSS
jgi:hypothetical protein